MQHIEQLAEQIQHCMQDRQRSFRNRMRRMRTRLKQQQDIAVALAQLASDIERSRRQRDERRAQLPAISYPDTLPVSQKRQDIADAIAAHPVVIVAGETGSGKTTQIPKICLQLGRGITAMIGHSQPRRIAARSVASRIADELNCPLGRGVGYKVRFSDRTASDTYIKLMTDGILLAEIQRDPLLLQYDTLIIDEAHERSLNIDFLLGYLKNILPKRRDLKLIITSATINTERFSRFFNHAPVIEVSGRSFPVDILYRPPLDDASNADNCLYQAIVSAVDEAAGHDALGDILIFLPGEREIRDATHALQQHSAAAMRVTEILPLYSRLSPAEQDRVFKSHSGRRIVLATNVAETSLTVPGIRFVIDAGLARISRYSSQRKIQCLPVEPISQASASQRAGRCGRVAAGICFRLYSEQDFQQRPEHTDPEIRRTHLASVILQMFSLGLGRIEDFTFMEPPEKRAIGDGYRLLEELQAIENDTAVNRQSAGRDGDRPSTRSLTALGRQMVRLPVDPRLARMLVQAEREGALQEVMIIVSALSVQDPRIRPAEQRQQADAKHRLFRDESSDFLSWLKLWQWYHEQARQLSRSGLRKLCQQHYLAYMRMREWHDLHSQLLRTVAELKMQPKRPPAKPDAVHRSLLAGLLSHVAQRHPEKGYIGARGLQLSLFPGSALARKPPGWLMAATLLATSRVFARDVAAIDPGWLEGLATHLIKRQYSEPHWSRKRAQVCAFEKLMLYGLTLVAGRRIDYGPIDPELSRELFIRHALVQMEYHTYADFFKYNKSLLNKAEKMEHKSRRRDVLADEQVMFDFFNARIPADICNGKRFELWRKQAEARQPRLLFLPEAWLLEEQAGIDTAALPDRIRLGSLNLKLSYHFDPGHKADGVTLHVPVAALGQLQPERFEWLVPGMLVEKLTRLIKSLPGAMRKHFVPAPEYARACAESMAFGEGSLLRAFSKQLQRMSGVEVGWRDWQPDKLPQHLHMNFSVHDEQGKRLAEDTNLALLQYRYARQARAQLQASAVHQQLRRSGILRWDFAVLPESVQQRQGRSTLQLFPALVDQQQSVAIELFESRAAADEAMRAGVRRLYMLSLNAQVQMLRKQWPGQREMSMLYATLGHRSQLSDDLLCNVFDALFVHDEALPRRQQDFDARLQARRAEVVKQGEQLAADVLQTLRACVSLRRALDAVRAVALAPVVADIRMQLDQMMTDGFIRQTPARWLQHLPRFLHAAEIRLGRAGPKLQQDQQHAALVQGLWDTYQRELAQRRAHGEDSRALYEYRWLLEELRVSLFAQNLKTSQPVSLKRLQKQWAELVH